MLLLDEPLGALDLKLRRQLQVELKRIQLEVGITFVYVTHDQEEALALSDRIAVMHAGKVEQIGAPEELYDAPRTLFVAGFIGTSNLLPGTVESIDGGDAVDPHWAAGKPARAAGAGLRARRAVDVAVRPEAIVVAMPNGRSADDRGLGGEIQQAPTSGRRSATSSDTGPEATIQAMDRPRGHER